MFEIAWYKNKKVLITGHTGFKGAWLSYLLVKAGAQVIGVSLTPPTKPNLFSILNLDAKMESEICDIRNYNRLDEIFKASKPEIVFHLAAQPIVRDSYKDPRYTYETNVIGTVNVLECIRHCDSVKSALIITTDKVYKNREWEWGYRENEELDGYDPYSNSKSCADLVTSTYKRCFLEEVSLSTVRAGNVIGGGDFANDRIIPDCIRAALNSETIIVRNPFSVRPYQHVLEPIYAYVMIAALQYEDKKLEGKYNIGPQETDCYSTGALVDLFVECWGENLKWESVSDEGPHEATFLKLDCSHIQKIFDWKPHWDVNKAIEKTVEWAKAWRDEANIEEVMDKQIKEYLESRTV